MPQITTVGSANLRATTLSLLDADAGPWASISMPVLRPWNERSTNRARLRTLLDAVRDSGPTAGLSAAETEALLAPAESLHSAREFWEGDLDGINLFLAPDTHTVFRLPFAPSAFSEVDAQMHVRPLWRHLEPDGTFYVLGLSAGGAALFRGSRYQIEHVPLPEGPTSLDDVLQFDDHIQSLRYHTKTPPGSGKQGRRSAIFYGHEDAGDKRYVKEGVLRFFRALDNQVRDVLDKRRTPPPLLLAGVEELRGLYRQVNKYQHLLDAAIEESVIEPESRDWDADELHDRAWGLIRPHFDDDRRTAHDQFHANPDQTAANPGTSLLAATEGRVDTLFVAEAPLVWGRFDDDKHSVEIHSERARGDLEFLNAAAVRTLRSGGTVYVVDEHDVPEHGPVAALLRY